MKIFIQSFVILLCISILFVIAIKKARSDTLSNQSFILETERETPQEPKIPASPPPDFKAKVSLGFQAKNDKFGFLLSPTLIDFGEISPGEPFMRAITLTVSYEPGFSYQVFVFEDHPLRALEEEIPDTTCDNGVCSESTGAIWENPLTYGFGFRCDSLVGSPCLDDFRDPSFFKQFANQESGEAYQTVMRGSGVEVKEEARLTYKVNISGTQKSGPYKNILTHMAIPNF